MELTHRSAILGFMSAMAATIIGIISIEFIAMFYPSEFWPFLLIAVVVFGTSIGGILAGISTSTITILYSIYFLLDQGFVSLSNNSFLWLVIPLTGSLLSILFFIAILKQKAEKKITGTRQKIEEEVDRRIKYYESTIQASEQRLRALLEHSFDSVVVIDEKGIILYASPSVERISGFKPGEIEGHNCFEFIHPDDLSETQKKMNQIMTREGAVITAIYRSKLKSGGWYWTEAGAINLLNNPAVRGVIINFRDITKRRESEEQIQASEKKFRSLFENMDEGFALCEMIYDPEGKPIDFRYLEVNPAWEQQTGLPRSKVVGHTVREVIPGIEQFWIDTYAQVVKTGQPAELESQVRELNRWFEVHATKHSENSFAVVFVDISDRKQSEESLRARTVELANEKTKVEEEKSKLDTIISAIGDAVFAVNLEGQIILFNQAAAQMTGYKSEESLGKHYAQIFQLTTEQDPRASYPDFVQEAIQAGEPRSLATHSLLISRDGLEIPISDLAAPFRDEKGKILGAVVVIRDNTKERVLEKNKDEFISVASHQLRTPLGSMRWLMELLLQEQSLSPELKQSLQQVYDNNKRMISLVNDLLNVSRIDQGRVPEKSQMIQPAQIIQGAINDMRQLAEKSQVQLQFAPPQNVPEVWFDPDRFHEIVENLLSNAIKYSNAGGQVGILLEPMGDKLRLTVSDQGIGIPETDQSRVFQKFFRAANAVQSETEGSGLGLFVVKSYVEKWGGTIWFESKEGKGTKFHVDLPVGARETEERKE